MLLDSQIPTQFGNNGDTNNLTFVNALLAAIPAGIVVTDRQGGIIYVNAEAERLFAYSSPELLGEGVDILLSDRFSQHHDKLRESYHHAPTTRRMGEGRDLFGRHKNGSEFPLELGLRPMVIYAKVTINPPDAAQWELDEISPACTRMVPKSL